MNNRTNLKSDDTIEINLGLREIGGGNIETYTPDVRNLFKFLLLEYYQFVRPEKKKMYLEKVKYCVVYLEAIVAIELQLFYEEIRPLSKDASEATNHMKMFFMLFEELLEMYEPTLDVMLIGFRKYCCTVVTQHVNIIHAHCYQ